MPLEIRELLIKTTVSNSAIQQPKATLGARELQEIKNQIITECLEKMREEIQKNKER